jgi:S1-C subfamily serine protease
MGQFLVVSEVISGSQAETIGIEEVDIIKAYNQTEVISNSELTSAIWKARNSNLNNVNIIIVRDSEEIELMVTVEPLGINCLTTTDEDML